MKEHRLKILYRYLVDINENGKTFEIRKNDRDFQKGDVVSFIPISETKAFVVDTSLHTKYRITYVFYGGEYGLDKDYCVFGIEPIKEQKK